MYVDDVKSHFIKRKGFFRQPYKSIRLQNCEITIDNLISNERIQLSVCTPYNEKLDKQKHKIGVGAGEVKKCWFFESEDKAFEFVEKAGMI